MPVIAPQTDVYLLKVPLEINDINQLTFANATAQFNYFNSLPKLAVDNYTYQRKDGTIRFGGNFDDLISFNYVMYRNEAYSNKWFYAYIDSMEYLNDNVTAISISTDVWQTWQFDLTFKRTFVEREHVNDDTIGSNTIDEGLELGDYVINSSRTLKPDKSVTDSGGNPINWDLPICFQVTELVGDISEAGNYYNSEYNRIFSGLYYFGCMSLTDARLIIRAYDSAGKGDAIVAIFLAPKEFFNNSIKVTGGGKTIYVPANSAYLSNLLDATNITRPSTLNGYTPKNNKLFCYPFSYVYVTNNTGIDTTFRYEDFTNATPRFFMAGALGQGCTTRLCPINYKSYTSNAEVFEYGIAGAKYPICAWATDYYTNWVTQNAVNNGLSIASGALSAGVNASYGNYVGTASSLLSSVGGVMAARYQAQVHPDQARGNTNQSDILVGWERYFTVDCMSVRYEIARTIDEFMSMFGYKVNRVKVPNIYGRRNWNYVKTIGCYIDADIPQTDLEQIKEMFDRGITLWHNPATFVDYSQNNDMI
jgi:hypothetical protein